MNSISSNTERLSDKEKDNFLNKETNNVVYNHGFTSFSSLDKNILENICSKANENTDNSNNKISHIKDSLETIRNINKNLRKYSMNTKNLVTTITQNTGFNETKNTNENSFKADMHIKYKRIYISPLANYSYLSNPNTLKLKFNIDLYNKMRKGEKEEIFINSISDPQKEKMLYENRENELHEIEKSYLFKKFINETSLSREMSFNFNTLRKQMSMISNTRLKNNFDVNFELGTSHEHPEFSGSQTRFFYKASLAKHFHSRSLLFRDYPYYDPLHYLTFFAQKHHITNNVDKSRLSPLFSETIPAKDTCTSFGVLYKKDTMFLLKHRDLWRQENKNIDNDDIYNIEAGCTHRSYSNNSAKILDFRFFYRKFFFFNIVKNNFLLQSSVETVNSLLLNKTSLLAHQENYVDDFKGVKKFRDYDRENNYFSPLAMRNHYKFYNKIYYIPSSYTYTEDNPVFGDNPEFSSSKQVFLPFVHCNLLFVPTNNEQKSEENTDTSINKNMKIYFSAGLGLTYISEYIALEGFYNAYVKKENNDYGTNFGINIGID